MTATREQSTSPVLTALSTDETARDQAEISMLHHTIEWCVEHEC